MPDRDGAMTMAEVIEALYRARADNLELTKEYNALFKKYHYLVTHLRQLVEDAGFEVELEAF